MKRRDLLRRKCFWEFYIEFDFKDTGFAVLFQSQTRYCFNTTRFNDASRLVCEFKNPAIEMAYFKVKTAKRRLKRDGFFDGEVDVFHLEYLMLKHIDDNADVAFHSCFIHMPAFGQYNGVSSQYTLRDLRVNGLAFNLDNIIVWNLAVYFNWNRTPIEALFEGQ